MKSSRSLKRSRVVGHGRVGHKPGAKPEFGIELQDTASRAAVVTGRIVNLVIPVLEEQALASVATFDKA